MRMHWLSKPFAGLSNRQVYELLALRCAVFVVEQQCHYQDSDGLDLLPETLHLLGYRGGQLLAGARLLPPGVSGPEPAIGRVCTAAEIRGTGLGHALLRRAIDAGSQRWPGQPLYLAAQAHLGGYYRRHGFVAVTDPYLEDGIPHIGMRRAGR